jgi:hypothetical protein
MPVLVGHDVNQPQGGVVDSGHLDRALEGNLRCVSEIDREQDSVDVGNIDGKGNWVGCHGLNLASIMNLWRDRQVTGVTVELTVCEGRREQQHRRRDAGAIGRRGGCSGLWAQKNRGTHLECAAIALLSYG